MRRRGLFLPIFLPSVALTGWPPAASRTFRIARSKATLQVPQSKRCLSWLGHVLLTLDSEQDVHDSGHDNFTEQRAQP